MSNIEGAAELVLEELILKTPMGNQLPSREDVSEYVEKTLELGHNYSQFVIKYLESQKRRDLESAGYAEHTESLSNRDELRIIPQNNKLRAIRVA